MKFVGKVAKVFFFTFATNKPNMSLNDWIKEQEQRGITTFSFQQIRCVTEQIKGEEKLCKRYTNPTFNPLSR